MGVAHVKIADAEMIASRPPGVTSSAGGSQDREHLPGYPLHVRNPPGAADDEVNPVKPGGAA